MSDLIEQLGGYQKAKKIWDLRPEPNDSGYIKYYSLSENQFFDEYAYEWCQIKKDWYETMKSTNNLNLISVRDLGLELLEYRRQHNIFEVGDYFCYESKYLSNDPLDGDAYKKLNQLDSIDFECGFVESALNRGGIIRHATDAEIKAGKRLEGSNDSTSSDHT